MSEKAARSIRSLDRAGCFRMGAHACFQSPFGQVVPVIRLNPFAQLSSRDPKLCHILIETRGAGRRLLQMMRMVPMQIGGHTLIGVEVKLPKTNLIAVATDKGYIMCGALDVALLNDRLKERGIVAGRAVGVRTLEQLVEAPLESVTLEAEKLGITIGMKGSEALLKML
jgi:uncharacterized protein YunC (DUF1805 family)